MFITTAGRTTQAMIEIAKKAALDLQVPYVPRKKQSVAAITSEQDSDCLVIGKDRMELYKKNEPQPFFFHPNSAMFRVKRLQRGERDPFIDAASLKERMSLLDCTLGLASDAITASYVVGEKGKVTGIEGQRYLSYMIKTGLKTWMSGIDEMDAAMRRISVRNAEAFTYLKELPDESFNCVYFDPMFEESILESDGIKSLGHFALREEITSAAIEEALRIAKNRVILKDHFKSKRFERFGFKVLVRKSAKFHFGYIEK